VQSAGVADAPARSNGPIANVRRPPEAVAGRVAHQGRTAKVRAYALTLHSSREIEACSRRRITGRTVATTSSSRLALESATEVIAGVRIVEHGSCVSV
jgi:hypothetical protein